MFNFGVCCCWHLQVLDQDYDWVFGSDVTYTEEALLPLAKLLRQIVLTNEQCVVKLAHMHRSKELDKAMRETFHGACSSSLCSCRHPFLFPVVGTSCRM
jgi:hypothetical protein